MRKFSKSPLRKVEGLRAVACARQDHALLVEGHHGRVVAVGERVPVLARGIGGVCLIVVVRKCRAAADADEAVVPGLLPVDIVFRGAFHGCPGEVRAVAHHPVGRMLAVTAARLRSQRLLAVGVHGHDLVTQRVAESGVIVVVAAYERTAGGLGSGQAAVEGHGFQCPAVPVAADGIFRQGGFRLAVRTADELVQRIGRVGQIDRIPHLGGADLQQMPGLVRGRQPGDAPFLRVEAVDVGDAQAIPRKDEHEVLLRQSIEAERQEHGLVFEAAQEQGPGAAAHVAVQAGQHVLHALHGTAVTGKVIAGGQDGGDLAAGEVVQGYAHGSSKKVEVAGWAGEPGKSLWELLRIVWKKAASQDVEGGMGIGQTQDARVHVAASVPARMLPDTDRDGVCRGRYPLQRKWSVPASAGAQAALASSHCHRPAVPGTQTQAGMSALASQSLPS